MSDRQVGDRGPPARHRARPLGVGEDAAGPRLARFLAVPVGSRAQAQALIDAGAVTVDGRVVPKRHAVVTGERIVVDVPERAPVAAEESPAAYGIAWEDEHLLVVDKPAGVVVPAVSASR